MERVSITERPDWREKAHEYGFNFHTMYGEPYWCEDAYYKLTLAQVEKAVGKKLFAESVGEYVTKKTGKPALVEVSDKRPAITNKISATEAFKEENENE